ncbi:hypothetical protein GCM10027059_34490 [Myceligenerans halotolerans]
MAAVLIGPLSGCSSHPGPEPSGDTSESTSQKEVAERVAAAPESTGNPSAEAGAECAELSTTVSDASLRVVDAFSLVDRNPDLAVEELRGIIASTAESTEGVQGRAADGAERFLDGLRELTDATEDSVEGSAVDGRAIRSAVAEFEDAARSSLEPCAAMSTDNTPRPKHPDE